MWCSFALALCTWENTSLRSVALWNGSFVLRLIEHGCQCVCLELAFLLARGNPPRVPLDEWQLRFHTESKGFRSSGVGEHDWWLSFQSWWNTHILFGFARDIPAANIDFKLMSKCSRWRRKNCPWIYPWHSDWKGGKPLKHYDIVWYNMPGLQYLMFVSFSSLLLGL